MTLLSRRWCWYYLSVYVFIHLNVILYCVFMCVCEHCVEDMILILSLCVCIYTSKCHYVLCIYVRVWTLCRGDDIHIISLHLYLYIKMSLCMALWSNGRHLALGSGDPEFESWLCQVDVKSLGKALYMHFLTPLMCKTSIRL